MAADYRVITNGRAYGIQVRRRLFGVPLLWRRLGRYYATRADAEAAIAAMRGPWRPV